MFAVRQTNFLAARLKKVKMKVTVNKIYEFIAKLISLLEDELNQFDEPNFIGKKNTLTIKKSIIITLNKLVTLIIQLNKLRSEDLTDDLTINQEDQDIIQRFIDKYNSRAKK